MFCVFQTLHFFTQGYSPEMLEELNKTSQGSAERQLHTLLYRMISRDDVNKPDIIVRVTAIIEGKCFRQK